MNSVPFKKIYIGTTDGETEAQNAKFEELFYNSNNKYEELLNNREKFLIIGSKGSGKTYLANYMCKKSKNEQVCKIINAQDFWLDKLNAIQKEQIDSEYAYALCKWFFLDKIAEIILEKSMWIAKINPFGVKRKLKKFYEKYENSDFFREIRNITTKSKEKETGFGGKRNSGQEAQKPSHELQSNSGSKKTTTFTVETERKKFYELISTYEKMVQKAIGKKDDIFLIFDDLDELSTNSYEDSSKGNVIINLIKVAKQYNKLFCDKQKKLRIILLIRTDILNNLQLYDPNLNKTKTSCGVELYWLTNSQTSPEEHPLMSMVLHKIKASCEEYRGLANRELFTKLFPESIESKKPLEYLLDYSYGRPRDIVCYLNHVIKEYPENTCFDAKSLKNVRKLYSADFYDELENEAYYHENPLFTKDCLQLIAGMKKPSFTYAEIAEYYEKSKDYLKNIDDLERAIKFLYKMGAIGNVWKYNKNIRTSWSYRKDSMDDVDLTKKFTIHYALRKKFSS